MPVQEEYGSSHISGGVGFMPSHEYTPSTANQNLPHEVIYVAPPPLCICENYAAIIGGACIGLNVLRQRS